MNRFALGIVGLLLSLSVIAYAEEATKEAAPTPTEKVKIGPVHYLVPKTWKRQAPSNSMRAAQFGIPLAEGDAGKFELTVFYFGPDQGGSVEQNIQRWLGQFKPLEGKEKVDKFKVGDIDVTVLDASGTYDFKPFPAAPQGELMKDWRMLASVVETVNEGPYFFRMVGPAKTIAAQEEVFRNMMKTLESVE
jgi:hypothetical protein